MKFIKKLFANSYFTGLLKVSLMGGMLYFVFSQIDIQEVKHHILRVNPFYFILTFLFQFISFFFSGMRSWYYHKSYGIKASYPFMQSLYFVGNLYNFLLPGGIGGDGYKVFYLNKYFKLKKWLGLRIQLYERVNGFYALSLYSFLIAFFSTYIDMPYVLFGNILLLSLLTPLYIVGIKHVLHDKLMVAKTCVIKYSMIQQGLQVISAVALCYGMDAKLDNQNMINFVFLFALGSVLATLPISIGGVGIREMTFLYGLSLLGSKELEAVGVSYALLIFLSNLLIAIVCIPFYLFIDRIRNRFS